MRQTGGKDPSVSGDPQGCEGLRPFRSCYSLPSWPETCTEKAASSSDRLIVDPSARPRVRTENRLDQTTSYTSGEETVPVTAPEKRSRVRRRHRGPPINGLSDSRKGQESCRKSTFGELFAPPTHSPGSLGHVR